MKKTEVAVSKLNEKDMYFVSFMLDGNLVEGKMEKSELRQVIGVLDNAIV